MGNTNSTNDKIRDFFNDSKLKDFGNRLGSYFGKFSNYAENMLNNMMKMSTNVSNFMSTSYLPYIVIGGVLIFVGIRMEII